MDRVGTSKLDHLCRGQRETSARAPVQRIRSGPPAGSRYLLIPDHKLMMLATGM